MHSVSARAAAIILVLGVGIAFAAYAWAMTGPAQDANIGAGLLFLVGIGVTIAGTVGLVGNAIKKHRRRSPGPGRD